MQQTAKVTFLLRFFLNKKNILNKLQKQSKHKELMEQKSRMIKEYFYHNTHIIFIQKMINGFTTNSVEKYIQKYTNNDDNSYI